MTIWPNFWVLLALVVFLSLVLLVLLIETAALTYEAWIYRKIERRERRERRERKEKGEEFLVEDGFWNGRLGGLFIQERWGPLIGLGASVVESVLLGMLTEVWIAGLVFVLFMVLFIGMWFATFVMNTLTIPP